MTDTHSVSLLAREGLMREPCFLLSMLNKLLSCHEIQRKTATIAELQWGKKKKESGELTETEPCERQTGKIFGLEARLAFHF